MTRSTCSPTWQVLASLTARGGSRVRGELLLELADELRPALAPPFDAIAALEEDGLLREAHAAAGAVGLDVDGGEGHGDALAAPGHRVAVDDAPAGDDVVVVGLVRHLRAVVEAEPAAFEAAFPKVGLVAVDGPALALDEPASLLDRIGEGREHPLGGRRESAFDGERVVVDGWLAHDGSFLGANGASGFPRGASLAP